MKNFYFFFKGGELFFQTVNIINKEMQIQGDATIKGNTGNARPVPELHGENAMKDSIWVS